ncbi:MAG TPA: Fic family protein [Thermoanaerobaculia bacterium]|nr:Fic family protein [Thermoanaerobaculia bacterium]
MARRTGTYVSSTAGGEAVEAFVPAALPPDPPVHFDSDLIEASELAHHALGRLNGLAGTLPDLALFRDLFVRREAVFSSQIEGRRCSLGALLFFEQNRVALPGVDLDDVLDVLTCVDAIEHGLARLREGCPASIPLLREVHRVLFSPRAGRSRAPGSVRTTQIRFDASVGGRSGAGVGGRVDAGVGGVVGKRVRGSGAGLAPFVPPPPDHLAGLLSDLERFLQSGSRRTSSLTKAALAHAQFETIHPFVDGNGRVGRLLIILILSADGLLGEPLLDLSLFFRRRRREYYQRLDRVRTHGDWEGWLVFFFEGVREAATGAVALAGAILQELERDRRSIAVLKRASSSCLQLHRYLLRRPVTTIRSAAREVPLTRPTIAAALRRLEALGIVEEITGMRRHKTYCYRRYLELLSRDDP